VKAAWINAPAVAAVAPAPTATAAVRATASRPCHPSTHRAASAIGGCARAVIAAIFVTQNVPANMEHLVQYNGVRYPSSDEVNLNAQQTVLPVPKKSRSKMKTTSHPGKKKEMAEHRKLVIAWSGTAGRGCAIPTSSGGAPAVVPAGRGKGNASAPSRERRLCAFRSQASAMPSHVQRGAPRRTPPPSAERSPLGPNVFFCAFSARNA
jgi:hypothetical protein